MGKQSRQRIRADKLALQRAQRTRATRPTITVPRVQVPAATYPVIAEADRLVLTEAVQRTVEEVTGMDEFQKCLIYALAGYTLLVDRGFTLQAGSVITTTPDLDNADDPTVQTLLSWAFAVTQAIRDALKDTPSAVHQLQSDLKDYCWRVNWDAVAHDSPAWHGGYQDDGSQAFDQEQFLAMLHGEDKSPPPVEQR